MDWNRRMEESKVIDSYYGEFKKGLLGKKLPIDLKVYRDHIEVTALPVVESVVIHESSFFELPYDIIRDVYVGSPNMDAEEEILIHFIDKTVVTSNNMRMIMLPGVSLKNKWVDLINENMQSFMAKKREAEDWQREVARRKEEELLKKETDAKQFYTNCYSYHIKETTPVYQLFIEKNKVALIYIGEDKSIHFLKIDGYSEEESSAVILYNQIHYYEKAGEIHYVSDIHGSYSSYGGSVTGGNFSKLWAVSGGLLFGGMGMALGMALTYKPAEHKQADTHFSIDSDPMKIDERSVILNFYSDAKKQYVDIELPADIYNFLQTHLPEKKYKIVLELEKKAAVNQSGLQIEEREWEEKAAVESRAGVQALSDNSSGDHSLEMFKLKLEKLKLMRDSELLTQEEFEAERKKILELI